MVAFVLLAAVIFNPLVKAQNPELQQRLAEVKQPMAITSRPLRNILGSSRSPSA